MSAHPAGGKAVNIEELEALQRAADEELKGPAFDSDMPGEACLAWSLALHNAAPALIAAKRRLEALEEAMRRFPINWIRNEINDLADQILKERSK